MSVIWLKDTDKKEKNIFLSFNTVFGSTSLIDCIPNIYSLSCLCVRTEYVWDVVIGFLLSSFIYICPFRLDETAFRIFKQENHATRASNTPLPLPPRKPTWRMMWQTTTKQALTNWFDWLLSECGIILRA